MQHASQWSMYSIDRVMSPLVDRCCSTSIPILSFSNATRNRKRLEYNKGHVGEGESVIDRSFALREVYLVRVNKPILKITEFIIINIIIIDILLLLLLLL